MNPDQLNSTNEPNAPRQAAKLEVTGNLFSVIGQSISLYASLLEIEEERQASETNDLADEVQTLKEQVSLLKAEMSALRQTKDHPRCL